MTNNEKKYQQEQHEQVRQAQQKNELAVAGFKKASNADEYRIALEQVDVLKDPEDIKKGAALLQDKHVDVGLRVLALQKIGQSIAENPAYINLCLAILSDTDEPQVLRMAVFTFFQVLSFFSRTFKANRSEYMTLLRSLLDDPDNELRTMAAEQLAKQKDEYVQRRLMDGLTGKGKAIVAPAKAIQFLAYDLHAEHFPVVRDLLQNTQDEGTKIEAIHVLAGDPQSKNLLVDLMLDKAQPKEVRVSSVFAVQSAHPDEFLRIAKPVVLDESEDDDVRVASLNALEHNKDALYSDKQFAERVSAISASTKSAKLKKMSLRYLDNTGRPDKNRPDEK